MILFHPVSVLLNIRCTTTYNATFKSVVMLLLVSTLILFYPVSVLLNIRCTTTYNATFKSVVYYFQGLLVLLYLIQLQYYLTFIYRALLLTMLLLKPL